jgi:hypothetical protein
LQASALLRTGLFISVSGLLSFGRKESPKKRLPALFYKICAVLQNSWLPQDKAGFRPKGFLRFVGKTFSKIKQSFKSSVSRFRQINVNCLNHSNPVQIIIIAFMKIQIMGASCAGSTTLGRTGTTP